MAAAAAAAVGTSAKWTDELCKGDWDQEMMKIDQQLHSARDEQLQEMLRVTRERDAGGDVKMASTVQVRVADRVLKQLPYNNNQQSQMTSKFWEGRQAMKKDALQACGLGAVFEVPQEAGRTMPAASGAGSAAAAAAQSRSATSKLPSSQPAAAGRSATQKPPTAPVPTQQQRQGYQGGQRAAAEKPDTPTGKGNAKSSSAPVRPPAAPPSLPGAPQRAPAAAAPTGAPAAAKRDRTPTPTNTENRRKDKPRRANPNIRTEHWDRSEIRKKMIQYQSQFDLSDQYTMPASLPVYEVFNAKREEYKKKYGTMPDIGV